MTVLSHKAVQHLLESSKTEFLRYVEAKLLCDGHEEMRMLLLDIQENMENQTEVCASIVADIKKTLEEGNPE